MVCELRECVLQYPYLWEGQFIKLFYHWHLSMNSSQIISNAGFNRYSTHRSKIQDIWFKQGLSFLVL